MSNTRGCSRFWTYLRKPRFPLPYMVLKKLSIRLNQHMNKISWNNLMVYLNAQIWQLEFQFNKRIGKPYLGGKVVFIWRKCGLVGLGLFTPLNYKVWLTNLMFWDRFESILALKNDLTVCFLCLRSPVRHNAIARAMAWHQMSFYTIRLV